eukprot:superscaffoldBa00000028_g559
MIDLSFLTEEEQETIRAVLRRDAELKKSEEQRVQNLQRTVSDRGQLRYLTGEWFYETKQLRHQDRIHGSDIIRASMKHTYKPLTILELSQILPEKPSFVSSENKEVFVPPVLCGLLQEPHMQLGHERNQNQNPYEPPQETPKPVLLSPTKQRKNPFNSELVTPHNFEEKDNQLLDGAVDQTQTPNEEPLPSSDSCVSHATNLKPDPNDSPDTQNASVSMPMPENQAVCTSSQDCFLEVDRSAGRQIISAAPRGILKRLSTSSSTDSLLSRLDLQSPVSLDSPTETWIDRKQVRFSSTVSRSGVEWQDGKELDLSEHLELTELLSPPVSSLVSAEQESGKPVHLDTQPEEDRHSQAEVTDWPTGHSIHQQKLPEQSTDISAGATSETKPSTNGSSKSSSHAVSPKPKQRLLGIFRREKEKTAQVQGPQKEQVNIFKKKEPENLSKDAADMTMDKLASVKQEDKPPEMTETDSDSTFENTSGWRRNTGSSTSNISLSSGMASMSSVSGSISSIYPVDFGDIEVQGSIQFAVNYIQKLGEFHIFVVHCRDLAVADTKKNRSDPYVKCYLLPDKTKLGKRKTTVRKKSLNPNYNEILRFKIIMEVLKTQSLNISVWHNDTFGRNSFLGEVDLDLSEWDFSNTQINEFALKPRLDPLGVSTDFNTFSFLSDGQQRTDESSPEIPATDVSHGVLPDTSRKSRQKTRVVKRTANPMFNHTMVYDGFRPEDLREACVEITVWDHDRLNNRYIGGLRLGLGTDTARALGLLEEYCTKLRTPEEQQLKTAIQRVMGIFKSNLFEALLVAWAPQLNPITAEWIHVWINPFIIPTTPQSLICTVEGLTDLLPASYLL